MTFFTFFVSKLQMSASQSPVSRNLLEKEITSKQKSLKAYKEHINHTDDEIICVLEAKKLKKEEELKKCYRIQCMAIFRKSFIISILYLNQNFVFCTIPYAYFFCL